MKSRVWLTRISIFLCIVPFGLSMGVQGWKAVQRAEIEFTDEDGDVTSSYQGPVAVRMGWGFVGFAGYVMSWSLLAIAWPRKDRWTTAHSAIGLLGAACLAIGVFLSCPPWLVGTDRVSSMMWVFLGVILVWKAASSGFGKRYREWASRIGCGFMAAVAVAMIVGGTDSALGIVVAVLAALGVWVQVVLAMPRWREPFLQSVRETRSQGD
jgi:hypothetical protein